MFTNDRVGENSLEINDYAKYILSFVKFSKDSRRNSAEITEMLQCNSS